MIQLDNRIIELEKQIKEYEAKIAETENYKELYICYRDTTKMMLDMIQKQWQPKSKEKKNGS